METVKQDIPDTLWICCGQKDKIMTVQDKDRFLQYFQSWKQPYKYRYKKVEFKPGFPWGTVQMESEEARNMLLKHVKDKPFRPYGENGWALNKFEKSVRKPIEGFANKVGKMATEFNTKKESPENSIGSLRSHVCVDVPGPKREQTNEEVSRTQKFAEECIELLRQLPECQLPIGKFMPAYQQHFGRQCRYFVFAQYLFFIPFSFW